MIFLNRCCRFADVQEQFTELEATVHYCQDLQLTVLSGLKLVDYGFIVKSQEFHPLVIMNGLRMVVAKTVFIPSGEVYLQAILIHLFDANDDSGQKLTLCRRYAHRLLFKHFSNHCVKFRKLVSCSPSATIV